MKRRIYNAFLLLTLYNRFGSRKLEFFFATLFTLGINIKNAIFGLLIHLFHDYHHLGGTAVNMVSRIIKVDLHKLVFESSSFNNRNLLLHKGQLLHRLLHCSMHE
jgi:hypothetical protein